MIQSFDGEPVNDSNSLRNRVANAQPGSKATVVVVRDGSEKTFAVTLDEAVGKRAERPGEPAAGDNNAALGVAVQPLTPERAESLGLSRSTRGVVVEDVNEDGRAADAGIQTGDVIQEINRQPVQSVEELRAAVRRTSDKPMLLLVNRQGRDLFVTIKPRRKQSAVGSQQSAVGSRQSDGRRPRRRSQGVLIRLDRPPTS